MNINKSNIKDIGLAFELKGECPTIVVSAFTNDNEIYVLGSYQLENGAVSIKGLIENNDYVELQLTLERIKQSNLDKWADKTRNN